MYSLKKLVNLIMVTKFFLKLLLFLFIFENLFSEVIYEKNNIIITKFDIEIYQQLYKENYNSEIFLIKLVIVKLCYLICIMYDYLKLV